MRIQWCDSDQIEPQQDFLPRGFSEIKGTPQSIVNRPTGLDDPADAGQSQDFGEGVGRGEFKPGEFPYVTWGEL